MLWGIVMLTLSLTLTFGVREGWYKLLIIYLGMFFGFSLTIWIVYLTSNSGSYKLLSLSTLQIAYIFVMYIFFKTILTIIPLWGIEEKYTNMMDAFHSIISSWLLSKILGVSSIIFSGFLFYTCVFLSTTIVEFLSRLLRFEFIFKLVPNVSIKTCFENLYIADLLVNKLLKSTISNTIFWAGFFPIIIFSFLKLFSFLLL